nr:sialic acid-binding Ig-like lectin 13 [Loxodonta africana]
MASAGSNTPALTQTPNIQILGNLESGRPRILNCTVPWACERGTPPIFSWMGASISPRDPMIPYSSVLILTPQPQDHGTNLTCQVTFPGAGVTTKRTIQLNVSYPPLNMTITVFRGNGTGRKHLSSMGLLGAGARLGSSMSSWIHPGGQRSPYW